MGDAELDRLTRNTSRIDSATQITVFTPGVGSIPVFFYTYNGAFGPSPDWLNILFFFLSAGLGFWIEWMLFREEFSLAYSWLAIGILILIATAFTIFTFYPPKLPIFQDPITKTYGVGRMTY